MVKQIQMGELVSRWHDRAILNAQASLTTTNGNFARRLMAVGAAQQQCADELSAALSALYETVRGQVS